MVNKSKTALIAFIPAVLICIGARFYQILNGIDMSSGFFYHDNSFLLSYCYQGLFVIFSAAIAAFAFLDRKKKSYAFEKKPQNLDGMGAIVIGSGFLLCAISMFYSVIEYLDAYAQNWFAIIVTAVFSLYMVSIGFFLLYTKEVRKSLGFLMLGISVYLIVRSSWTFLSFMVVASVSERLISVLMPLLGSLFFLSAGRFFMQKENKFTRIWLIGLGSSISLLTFSAAVSKVLLKLFAPKAISDFIMLTKVSAENTFQLEQSSNFNYMYLTSAEDIVFAVLAFAVVVLLFTVDKHKKEAEE